MVWCKPPAHYDRSPHRYALRRGTELWRIHRRPYEAWQFKPEPSDVLWGGARFDATDADKYPYLYVGLSSVAALGEILLRDVAPDESGYRVVLNKEVAGRIISKLTLSQDLHLVDLTDAEGLGAIGQDRWLVDCSGHDYAFTRDWAHWVRRKAAWAHGLIWDSKRMPASSPWCCLVTGSPATMAMVTRRRFPARSRKYSAIWAIGRERNGRMNSCIVTVRSSRRLRGCRCSVTGGPDVRLATPGIRCSGPDTGPTGPVPREAGAALEAHDLRDISRLRRHRQGLKSMGADFEPFGGKYDCDLLFINCGTGDRLDAGKLRSFVHSGGCLYASDLTSGLITEAFPGVIRFGGSRPARSPRMSLTKSCARLSGTPRLSTSTCPIGRLSNGVKARPWSKRPGARRTLAPLMVEAEHGEGAIFYTSFHNRAQVSEQEKILLQLLVLKQISTSSKTTVAQASQSLGISLSALKKDRRP